MPPRPPKPKAKPADETQQPLLPLLEGDQPAEKNRRSPGEAVGPSSLSVPPEGEIANETCPQESPPPPPAQVPENAAGVSTRMLSIPSATSTQDAGPDRERPRATLHALWEAAQWAKRLREEGPEIGVGESEPSSGAGRTSGKSRGRKKRSPPRGPRARPAAGQPAHRRLGGPAVPGPEKGGEE